MAKTNLWEMTQRYMNIEMRGTWGYQPEGVVMLTDRSMVKEFYMTASRKEGDEYYVKGTDKYGRFLRLPADKIIAIEFLDTKEQSVLRSCMQSLEIYEAHKARLESEGGEYPEILMDDVRWTMRKRDELISMGVTPYQRAK